MSFPFFDKKVTFTQPDGTKIRLRGWGDQHYAIFETLDGYTVTKNPGTGFFEVAQVSTDGNLLESAPGPQGNLDGARVGVQPHLRINRDAARARGMEGALRMGGRRCDERREKQKNLARAANRIGGPVMAPPQRTTKGDFVGLCLLIDFPDEPGTIPRDEVERFCNEQGYSGFENNGSVSDYFSENSLDRCRYTNIVANYYQAQHPKSYYTDPAIPQGTRARQLINEALTYLEANNFDFSPLTADSDGYVYAMNVYYAGEVDNNWAEGLWPHSWHMGTPVSVAPGKSVFDYQFTDMSQQLALGTFCHENGHMLCDYPDLYDYGGESSGVGAYCLMCSGANINDRNPTNICAYLKRLSGWSKSVTQIQHNQEISLSAGENEYAIFSKNNSEYFLVEPRVKNGRDESLPDEGLAIWHIDELNGSNNNEQMTPGKHYELSLEQADGEFRLENSMYHYGDTTDLFGQARNRFANSTVPDSKWWDGTASNLDILDISPPGPAMSFKTRLFTDDNVTETVKGESAPDLSIPDNNADGIIDNIAINQNGIISGVKVTLDISHTYRGDLCVTLFAPWGDTIVLHQRHQGGREDNIRQTIDESDLQTLSGLHGHNTSGEWRLQVQDLAALDKGTLNYWALEFNASVQPQGPIVLEEAPGAHIPDNDRVGIRRVLSTNDSGFVSMVEVSVDITHTWIGDLQISLRSPAGTEIILHDETGGSADDIVKTYTTATTPGLSSLEGQLIRGDWQLFVSDRAGQDYGKLNKWKLVIHPAA